MAVTTYVVGTHSGTVLSGDEVDLLGAAIGAGFTVASGGVISAFSGGRTFGSLVQGRQVVGAQAVDSGSVVSNGGVELVLSGGVAIGLQVLGGTSVASGGTVILTTVSGRQEIYSGGVASNTIVKGGGYEVVLRGALANGAIVSSGGEQIVLEAGIASGTTINFGGKQSLNGTAYATTVGSGGSQVVNAGGLTISTIINSGGVQLVTSGGQSNSAVISAQADQYIADGGYGVDTTIGSGGSQQVNSGGRTHNSFVRSGGLQAIAEGASDDSTTIIGGTQLVLGATSRTTIFGGIQNVYGGMATSTTVSLGGSQVLSDGGNAAGTIINSGSRQVINGGTANGTTLNGGRQIINGGTANGTIIRNGGNMVVNSGGSAVGTMVTSGGRQNVFAGGTATSTRLDSGGVIDIQYLSFASSGTATLDSDTNVLTITQGGVTTTLGLTGSYAGEYFHLTSDTDGSTFLFHDANPACYCHGTLILTDQGEVAVEALSVGDVVVTASGAPRPIRWLGRRSYAGRFLRANPGVQPIRFRAGSLGGVLPRRDLLVSPNHAMLLDGVLVPAGVLVNGTTIVRERGAARVEYVHVELDGHDVLLAEGAPSESFVDDDSRGVFHNADEWRSLHPGRPRVAAVFCAPRVEDGARLEAIRGQLAALADKLMLVA